MFRKKLDLVEVFMEEGAWIEEGAIVGYRVSDKPVVLKKNVRIHAGAIVYSGCEIGENTDIYHNTILMQNSCVGAHAKIGSCCVAQGDLKIGSYVTIVSHCHLTSHLVIEDGAFLGMGVHTANALLPGGRLHRKEMKTITPPRIERGARIGGNVMINPGVVVGAQALIGAGSIVAGSIPPFKIAVGVPARIIGEVPEEDRIQWSEFGLEERQ